MSRLHEIILRPIVTEKSTMQADLYNKVTFKVARDATKPQIKSAIEQLFGVKVDRVNTHIIPGKPKRHGRELGRTAGYKKAIVQLAEGESIDFFALEGEGGEGDLAGEDFGLDAFEDEDDDLGV